MILKVFSLYLFYDDLMISDSLIEALLPYNTGYVCLVSLVILQIYFSPTVYVSFTLQEITRKEKNEVTESFLHHKHPLHTHRNDVCV